jgi:hypothetical protein
MEVGPPGSPCRRRAQTAAVSCRSRAGVGSDCGKGPLSAGQVSDEKTNVCEPLLTHRNRQGWHRNRRMCRTSGTKACPRGVPSAGERPACGPGGARCKGGVSSSQALAWNRRTCRLDTDGQRCVLAARGRTPSDGNREGQSTARHRGGPARSSDEGPVMGLERRGVRRDKPAWRRSWSRSSTRTVTATVLGARPMTRWR